MVGKCLHSIMKPSLLKVVSWCSGVTGAPAFFFFFREYYQGRELPGLKFGPIFDELNVNLLTGSPFPAFKELALFLILQKPVPCIN